MLIDVVMEGLFWIMAEAVGWLLRAVERPRARRESYDERRRRVRIMRRNRAIERWLKKGKRDCAIPNIGLRCPRCSYLLNGLTTAICPECGGRFDIATMIDDSAERRQNNNV